MKGKGGSRMREEKVDAWKLHGEGQYLCILTNGTVKEGNRLVMGKGIALEAKEKFFNLPNELGKLVKNQGNRVYNMFDYRIISFPVKHAWWCEADIKLIEKSAKELKVLLSLFKKKGEAYKVVLPRPGCGLGRLSWEEVKKVILPILGECENLTVVTN
jgi:O-acetyl-ADP-ribose deacetylase (regulator of RNase III)